MPKQARLPEVIPSGPPNSLPAVAYYAPIAPQQEFEAEAPAVPLTHYLWILRRHRWKIIAFVATCVLITAIVSARLQPIYESASTVNIDFQAPSGVVGQDSTNSYVSDPETFLATQIRLIQSDAVLRPVAEQYHLLNPGGQSNQPNPTKAQAMAAAPVSLGPLKVTRPTGTNLLLISYRSADPHLAADVANAIANSYLVHAYNIRIRTSASLSSFMEKQLDELKAKMEHSNLALGQFEKDLNVINPEDKSNILSARLLQLNTEYTNAQIDRVNKEAALDAIKSGTIEAAQVSSQGESLAKLNDSLNQARQHFALVKATYGTSHPEYRKAASQLAEVEKQFEEVRNNIAERVEVQYSEALNREQILGKTVADTKAEWDSLSSRSFQYRQLKQEADADKALYDELVKKIQEADINAGFQDNNISIADPARPSLNPVYPDKEQNLLLAFLLSSFLAIGFAVLVDSINTTLRDPQEASRFLGVDVIGTMPVDHAAAQLPRPIVPAQAETTLAKVIPNPNRKGYSGATSGFEEAIRTIRNTILLSDFEGRLRSIALTSATPSEGKTTIAAHLAIANADRGKKTLLVDGDLRRPSLHSKFGITPKAGLSNVLTGELPWQDVVLSIDGMPNLSLLPAGPGSHRAADLIGPRLSPLLDEFAKEYDLVIMDSPPLLGFAEALQISTVADGVLIISLAGETKRKAVAAVVSALQRIRANIIGVILNQVSQNTTSDAYSQYGYYRYGHYGYGNTQKPD
ncbi:MAG TPA: polysaccharide biosynthesis tyrosine autokinase [Terracidiphilus sp.]|nr:polysaccharide biosynthesis tyrosine autokinase [Terracidiphilus sp.]